ncbi:hypothetical protein PG999_003620 [Apiospora kogelbergensis]|uniref:Uncharacterized protein n=1 Tax=Apiospora kogelbergensis TaxID=1337665 RepID=A0AAW0R447_9PEZI
MQAAQSTPQQISYSGRPGTSSKFDSHDDFYDFLDSNRGANGGPPPQQQSARPSSINSNHNTNNMAMGGSPNVQRPIPINGPGPEQSRPPVTRGAGGAQMRGSRSEEMLVDKHRDQRERERRQQQQREQQQAQLQQQQGASPAANSSARKPLPGGPRSPSSDSPSHNAPWRSGSGAHPPQQQARPTSSDSVSSDGRPVGQSAMGAAIQRLKSPSVMDCVLQPLESKVTEYLGFMTAEEDSIARLDAEISLLQARKAEAESRHAEAKAKHDDYRRQYADVERALRGDAPPLPGMRHAATATPGGNVAVPAPAPQSNGPTTTRELQQMQQQQQQQGGMGRPSLHNPQHDDRDMDDMDDDYDDDDDEYQQRRPGSRRIMSQQSFGRGSQQGKKSRFRFSLFGGDK